MSDRNVSGSTNPEALVPAGFGTRLLRFLEKPWRGKVASLGFRWLHWFPHSVFPVRLPFGAWWLATSDVCGIGIVLESFEPDESAIMQRLIKPGMTVLDIGAHHGLYSLLASRAVGPDGSVVSFEPSPRERRLLLRHLRLNRCTNAAVEECALGSRPGQAELFLVEGSETGCNSLRPPNTSDRTSKVTVAVETLDAVLQRKAIARVDFIKMDAEGGELEILRGATELFERRPRPIVLSEIQDIRTHPWGYAAWDIIDFLKLRGYSWFIPLPKGRLVPLTGGRRVLDGNFVAVPQESLDAVRGLIDEDCKVLETGAAGQVRGR